MKPSLRHLLIACCIAICAVSTLGAQAFLCAGHAPDGPLAAAKIAADEWLPVLPTKRRIGPIYILTVFARFADEEPTPVPEWADQLFAAEREGSFAHFYHTMSFGQLAISGEVLPRRFAASQPATAYLADVPGHRGRYGDFAREILAQVDAQIDLARFDNDGPDGVPNSGDDGWVDPAEDSAGIGRWGLMGWGAHGWDGLSGPVAFSARSLEQLGWIGAENERLILVERDSRDRRVRDLYAGGAIYKIPLRAETPNNNTLWTEYLREVGRDFYRAKPDERTDLSHRQLRDCRRGARLGGRRDVCGGKFADSGFSLGTDPRSCRPRHLCAGDADPAGPEGQKSLAAHLSRQCARLYRVE